MTLLTKVSDYFARRRDIKWARRTVRNYEENIVNSYEKGQSVRHNVPQEVETAYLVLQIDLLQK